MGARVVSRLGMHGYEDLSAFVSSLKLEELLLNTKFLSNGALAALASALIYASGRLLEDGQEEALADAGGASPGERFGVVWEGRCVESAIVFVDLLCNTALANHQRIQVKAASLAYPRMHRNLPHPPSSATLGFVSLARARSRRVLHSPSLPSRSISPMRTRVGGHPFDAPRLVRVCIFESIARCSKSHVKVCQGESHGACQKVSECSANASRLRTVSTMPGDLGARAQASPTTHGGCVGPIARDRKNRCESVTVCARVNVLRSRWLTGRACCCLYTCHARGDACVRA